MLTPLIQVDALSRHYGTTVAVDQLTFEVARGEVVGFLGPNGAGKSTTMQMLTGNLAPTAGAIQIHGIDLLQHPVEAKAGLGYLPERPPLYGDMTVDEFLLFVARLHLIPKQRQQQAVALSKERCGLGEVGGRLINHLSKGFQQRVGIAQAIIHNPACVILDEPTVGLDPLQIRSIRTLIRELAADHSVILSTHILPEVQATCDRVQIIHRGVLIASDTIAALTARVEGETLLVRLDNPPPLPQLQQQLPTALLAEELAPGRFRIHYPSGHNPAQWLVERSVAEGWRLQELTPERRSLEEFFVDITCDEVAT